MAKSTKKSKQTTAEEKPALFGLSRKLSSKRSPLVGDDHAEGIAPAISEEGSIAKRGAAAARNLRENTNKAEKPTKETKLLQNLKRTIEEFLGGKGYRPISKGDLSAKLRIIDRHEEVFEEVLIRLTQEGKIEDCHGVLVWKQSGADIVKGVLSLHPKGFGFVRPDSGSNYSEDIFIPKHLTQNAVDGDKVEVLVNTEAVSEKGPEGKIISILSRSRTHLAGIIRSVELYGDVFAYVPVLGVSQRVLVDPVDFKLRTGDRVVMEVVDWGSKDTETQCKMSHLLGHISDPSCDVKAAIEEFELRDNFPVEAENEARSYGVRVSKKDMTGREDLRDWECFTIDPDTAKDYDDAISLTKDKKGNYRLGVHIADVSHYVRTGTSLDEEARQRCNSTYFPGFCLPMLPRALSDNLCSLKQNVNRLTVSVIMDIDREGNVFNYRISRTLIRSKKRFTYGEAKKVLDGKKKSKHEPTLRLMVELCGHLKKQRFMRGSLEFAIPELFILVDEKGTPIKPVLVEYDITHQLVEEFMLKANEMVATHSSKIGKGLAFRVHDIPAEESMKDFAALAAVFGFSISENPNPVELQNLFEEALQTPYGQYLATSYIRRMRLAVYSEENIGHYGLALSHYTHFTSPIRRYIDLVVHRILFDEFDFQNSSIKEISEACSEQERISAKAESRVVLLKKLRLLVSINKNQPMKQYEAIVTRVKNFGFSFEILDIMLESFIHVSELYDDYYQFVESNGLLRGVRTSKSYSAGDKVLVMLKNVDLITLETKWSLVEKYEETDRPPRPKDGKKGVSKKWKNKKIQSNRRKRGRK